MEKRVIQHLSDQVQIAKYDCDIFDLALITQPFCVVKEAGLTTVIGENLPVIDTLSSDWSLLKLDGPFSFDQYGILSSILLSIAKIRVSVLVFSSFDTDYILIKTNEIEQVKYKLQEMGHLIKDLR